MQDVEKSAIEHEASLLAFDRQNHMGASEALTSRLRQTISEEAEVLLSEKHTASAAVNIRENEERMKVCVFVGGKERVGHLREAVGVRRNVLCGSAHLRGCGLP
jgi:hypothetical protein